MAYRRADLAATVVRALREVQPRSMYVAFDGPKVGEALACAATRDAVLEAIDWGCELRTLVRDTNLGCREAVSSGIDWFLTEEPDGVILEDDTVPSRLFLEYARELLHHYRSDDRIAMISGTNLLGAWPAESSYFFGDGGVWGWATWRRAWTSADATFSIWDDREARRRARAFYGEADWHRLRPAFEAVRRGKIDTWDYQWSFIRASRGQLSTIPTRNLVRNIGFRADATHTRDPASTLAGIGVEGFSMPLEHPRELTFERPYQQAVGRPQVERSSVLGRLLARARR